MKLKLMRWTGGKYRMTQIINPLMPECSEYYEPFLGSGAVLLNKCRTEKEIVNDLDEDLYKLHTVLADHDKMTELLNRLDKHPVNEETFIQAKECLDKKPENELAWMRLKCHVASIRLWNYPTMHLERTIQTVPKTGLSGMRIITSQRFVPVIRVWSFGKVMVLS